MSTTHPIRGAEPLPLVLAGARGHGRSHLLNIHRLEELGLVRLAGICELRPLDAAELDGAGNPEQSDDFEALLASTGARIAVLSTPIQTHTGMTLAAARHGAHVLLEKPPAPSYAEFRRMTDGVEAAGVACQIGFQSLGSHAVPAIRLMIEEGLIGELVGVGAAGAWVRDEAYFRRAPWAGRRRLNGSDVVDGALTNRSFGLSRSEPAQPHAPNGLGRTGPRRTRPRASDTHPVRGPIPGGQFPVRPGHMGTARGDGEALNHHSGGAGAPLAGAIPGVPDRATPTGPGNRKPARRRSHDRAKPTVCTHPGEKAYGRTDLLENLVAHVTGGDPLWVPPAGSGAFMRVVEAVRTAPDPRELPAAHWHTEPGESAPRRVVDGIDALVDASADSLRLFSELGAPWASPARAEAR